MRNCFVISVLFGLGGLIYNGFSEASIVSLLFISVSASPLLICSIGIEHIEPKVAAYAASWFAPLRWVLLALAVLNVIVFVYASGFRIQDLVSTAGIIAFAQQATTERYDFGSSVANPLLIAATFASAFAWATARVPLVVAAIAALVPPAAYSILSTEKWPFYCAISFFITSILLSRGPKSAVRQKWRLAGIVVVVGFAVGLLSLATRRGLDEDNVSQSVLAAFVGTLAHYMFAQYEAFGQWLAANYANCCAFGANTFVGPADLLGLVERQQGIFTDTIVVRGQETNIYTAWRYLVQDFSVFGPVILIGAYAMAYRYCVLAGRVRTAVAMLVILMICTLLQNYATIFVYNTVALSTFVCALIFAWAADASTEPMRTT